MEDNKKIIQDSKKRCKKMGLDPLVFPVFTHRLHQAELLERKRDYNSVLNGSQIISNNIIDWIGQTPLLVMITDYEGYLLKVLGHSMLDGLLEQLRLLIGVKFIEEEFGTNSITLALKHHRSICLVGNDHYLNLFKNVASYTTIIEDKNKEESIGTITMMTNKKNQHPLTLGFLDALAKDLEREFLIQQILRLQK